MNDNLTDRAKTMLGTLRYAQFHRTSPAYPDDVLEKTIGELVDALESAQSHKSLPPGMVWQDYYSPDDVLKIREPLDAEIERLRAGGPWLSASKLFAPCKSHTTAAASATVTPKPRTGRTSIARTTDKLGYGDGVTEPAAELADLLDPIKAAFSEAREHNECPRLCEQCGEHRATTRCPECHGSGCHNAMCEASGAYSECEYCAGVGWVHEGCAEASYEDLADEVKKLRGVIETVRNIAGHTAIGGWEHALLEILDLTAGIEKP